MHGLSGEAGAAGFEVEFERLARALLAAVREFGSFDTSYVTAVDPAGRRQVVRAVVCEGEIGMPLGHEIAWPPDTAEHHLLAVTRTSRGDARQPDSDLTWRLGFTTYVSVPVVLRPHRLYGTLAAAARPVVEVGDAVMAMMDSFAGLLADVLSARLVDEAVRRAEQAEAELRERVTFLAEAEHKLKTPLSIVSGWASTLVMDDARLTDDHRRAGLHAIDRNACLLVAEVTRMLEEAKAQIHTTELVVGPVDAAEVLQTITQEFGVVLPSHRVGYTCDEEVVAVVDKDALHQALAHLVDNAAKYSPPASRIDLSARADGGWVVIEVVDEGAGLPHDVDVFAPFQRGPSHPSHSVDGAGLGLHIVRKLVGAMGGEVDARPNRDRGSTFAVRVPAATATSPSGRSAT